MCNITLLDRRHKIVRLTDAS